MIVRKVLEFLPRRAKVQLCLLLALLTGVALLEAMGIASVLPFMALVINPEEIQNSTWLSRVYQFLGMGSVQEFLIFVGTVLLVLVVSTNVGKAVGTWFTHRYIQRQAYLLSRRVLVNYLTQPYAFFLKRNASEMGEVVMGQAIGVMDRLLRPMVDIVATGVVCLAIISVLLLLEPLAAAVVLTVVGGSYAIAYLLVQRKLDRIGKQQVEDYASRARSAYEALVGIKDVKILGRESVFLDRYAFFMERVTRNAAFATAVAQVPRYVLEIISFGGLLLAVLHFVSKGEESAQVIPVLAMYGFAGYRLLPQLQLLFNAVVVMRYNIPLLDRVHTELTEGLPTGIAEKSLRSGLTAVPTPIREALELRDVVFKYDGAMEPSLRGLNMRIERNTSVGLVGPTGCGKTTTVDVILGLLQPDQGSVVLDGVPITDQNRAMWQRSIGYVPQSIFISDDTVARNIAFGIPDEQIDMEAVRRAAAVANLAEFVESDLPEKYDTRIGDRGARLSGGQRQRIGIARALYRDPSVLVMDEATSALDGLTEEGIMEAMRRLAKRKTIIMIAHRLSTVRECDVIYQLDRGRIVTSGTYDELMRDSSWFREAALGAE